MIIATTTDHDFALQGIAHALGISPDEAAAALIDAGILWLTARELGRPMDGLDLEQWPGTARISRVLGAAYKHRERSPLWTPGN